MGLMELLFLIVVIPNVAGIISNIVGMLFLEPIQNTHNDERYIHAMVKWDPRLQGVTYCIPFYYLTFN